jgi:hypothetical protein
VWIAKLNAVCGLLKRALFRTLFRERFQARQPATRDRIVRSRFALDSSMPPNSQTPPEKPSGIVACLVGYPQGPGTCGRFTHKAHDAEAKTVADRGAGLLNAQTLSAKFNASLAWRIQADG